MTRLPLLLLAAGCFHVVKPRAELPDEPEPGAFPHDIFDGVLKAHVTPEGRVDYAGIQADRSELDRYVAYLAAVSPHSDPALFPTQEDQLAYWINAYNALAITAVVDRPGLQTVIDDKADFFYTTRYLLGGEKVSLYTLENGIVRKEFADPRIHFALNCQSGGCPTLPDTVFPAKGLDAFLDAETREFANDPRKVNVDGATLRISQIFEWYADDFAAAGGAPAFVRKYRSDVPPTPAVEFIPYDWTLIAQEGRMP